MERMALVKNTDVHLETVEITENKDKEADKARNSRIESVSEWKHTKGLLGYSR